MLSLTLSLTLLMKQFNVFPECNVDTNLVGFLVGGFAKYKVQAATDPKLRNLFDRISGCPELQRLKNTLKYLVNMQYEADAAVARQFFDGTLTSDDLSEKLSGMSF